METIEKWNLNKDYLTGIGYLRMVYIQARLSHDHEVMFDTLEQLEIEISADCKDTHQTDLKKVRQEQIEWLSIHKDNWCSRDKSGNPTHINNKNRRIILKRFNEAYREVLKIAERSGLLTYQDKDPNNAVQQMSSA